MLKVKKTGIFLNNDDLLELASIIVDKDEERSLTFLQKCIYEKIRTIQRNQ